MRIIILPYDCNWPKLFEEEKVRLQQVLSDRAVSIQHIGSTSVPGLAAKPIIDILIAIPSLAEADEFCIQPLIDLGYEYGKEFEIKTPQRRFFRLQTPDGVRTHNVHLARINSDWWVDHLLFRDYLRGSAETRRAYEALKRSLAEREWETSQDYTEAKTEFILNTLQEARAWRQGICYC
jgi:GrpB-like predicted nucleotidyltransferase (UPF0157 family)